MHAPDGARAASGLTNFRWTEALGRNVKLWGGLTDGFGVSFDTTRLNDMCGPRRFERAMSGTVTTVQIGTAHAVWARRLHHSNVQSDPACT